jgi:hypothetical protein
VAAPNRYNHFKWLWRGFVFGDLFCLSSTIDVQGTDLTVARDRAREFKARLEL